jgi:hypothetical protein
MEKNKYKKSKNEVWQMWMICIGVKTNTILAGPDAKSSPVTAGNTVLTRSTGPAILKNIKTKS